MLPSGQPTPKLPASPCATSVEPRDTSSDTQDVSLSSLLQLLQLSNSPYVKRKPLCRGDLSRVANAALRSTSFLRHAPVRSGPPCGLVALPFSTSHTRHISTTRIFGSLHQPAKSIAASAAVQPTQQRQYNSSWASPTRVTRGSPQASLDKGVQKPTRASYDIAFPGSSKGGLTEFASDLGEEDMLTTSDFKDEAQTTTAAPLRPPMRLAPRLGRTIHVKPNGDVAYAFKMLGREVALNGVPGLWRRQKFHERAGMRRKRVKHQRWVKKFRLGFKATVDRVLELKAQGW
ncbi:hypothetical protein F5Y17DRAFT_4818 [Xylariaceae sp. FL0594]|nr:hypothetical protein F5Y17DRAFT_4818 [Xylariaceae sp. FL0594]